MTPFYTRFAELAARETRSILVPDFGGPLPAGEYGFVELFCEDPTCDCRRVLLQVTSAQQPHMVLATINYGWETAEFYTHWMHGDAQAEREIIEASLDPLNTQSQYAEYLLDVFRDIVKTDPGYVARLSRHYDLFKSTQKAGRKPSPPPEMPPSVTSDLVQMTIPEILRQLQNVPEQADFAPYKTALLVAAALRETITPELIAAIDRVSANPDDYLKRPEDCLHLFAIYLLADFRESRALDSFLRFFSLSGEQALNLTGDMITENGAPVIASVCGGDPAPLLRLARDEAVNEFVRGQAIDGLLVQCVWGERPRDAVIADLRALFSTLPKPGDAYVWAQLVGAVNDFNAIELLPEARQAFAENLVDEGVIALEDIDPDLQRKPLGYLLPDREELYEWFCERNAPIDAVEECSGWLCFCNEDENPRPWDDDTDIDDNGHPDDAFGPPPDELPGIISKPTPYIAPPKVGRNDPCPCGSGSKYKKCCGK